MYLLSSRSIPRVLPFGQTLAFLRLQPFVRAENPLRRHCQEAESSGELDRFGSARLIEAKPAPAASKGIGSVVEELEPDGPGIFAQQSSGIGCPVREKAPVRASPRPAPGPARREGPSPWVLRRRRATPVRPATDPRPPGRARMRPRAGRPRTPERLRSPVRIVRPRHRRGSPPSGLIRALDRTQRSAGSRYPKCVPSPSIGSASNATGKEKSAGPSPRSPPRMIDSFSRPTRVTKGGESSSTQSASSVSATARMFAKAISGWRTTTASAGTARKPGSGSSRVQALSAAQKPAARKPASAVRIVMTKPPRQRRARRRPRTTGCRALGRGSGRCRPGRTPRACGS